ncbi:hypothetical protein [Salinibacterium sp. SWN1162]|uniref:hypothetical protein n=1 Tax=Salinibacterium sp. SWN1162 TaxID=2792053 RepID=UPI0018CC7D1B|nr:hypothetical protein [Salinibacterium sp. SWN1162]MBH0009552.1 hypothetical protein [Salinibacterium sp. SWN1162]
MDDGSATENRSTLSTKAVPFVGVVSLVAGSITPAWVIVGSIAGGPESGAWVLVVLLIGFPFNLVALALLIGAVISGVCALRRAKADRVLGRIGLTLAGFQILAAVVLTGLFVGAFFGH